MTRYAHAVFCDDIRQEVGGKITLVGMYAGQCLVPQIPSILPKLCLLLSISATKANPLKSVTATGVFAGNEVFRMEFDEKQINEIMAASFISTPEKKTMMLMLMGVMSPFQVSDAGKLTLSVIADGEELSCEGLTVAIAPPDTTFSF